jgi:hypothetical protein
MYEPFLKSNLLRLGEDDSDYAQLLTKTARAVKLEKLPINSAWLNTGMKSINFGVQISDDTITEMKKLIVAQAKIENLAHDETNLVIRWIMPHVDLADPWGTRLETYDWWIPPNGGTFRDRTQLLYVTNAAQTRNDRKIYLLFGVGFGKDASRTVQSYNIKRSDVRTLAIISMSHLEPGQVAPIDPVVMMKRNDDLAVEVNMSDDVKGRRDHVILYAWVCEPYGVSKIPEDPKLEVDPEQPGNMQ